MAKTEIITIRVTQELKDKLTKAAGHKKLLVDHARKILEESVVTTGGFSSLIQDSMNRESLEETEKRLRSTPYKAPNGRPRIVKSQQ